MVFRVSGRRGLRVFSFDGGRFGIPLMRNSQRTSGCVHPDLQPSCSVPLAHEPTSKLSCWQSNDNTERVRRLVYHAFASMHGWMDRWMDGWTDVPVYVSMYLCIYVREYVFLPGWLAGPSSCLSVCMHACMFFCINVISVIVVM